MRLSNTPHARPRVTFEILTLRYLAATWPNESCDVVFPTASLAALIQRATRVPSAVTRDSAPTIYEQLTPATL